MEFNIPPTITLEVPTETAADLALVLGAILARAEGERMRPTWTQAQQRSFEATRDFAQLLADTIVRTMREGGVPDDMLAQFAGVNPDQLTIAEEPPDAAA